MKKEKRRRPLVARQCEDLVVIHDGVEGLDPHRIDVAIEENPLGSFSLEVRNVPHDARKEAVLPLLLLSEDEQFLEVGIVRRKRSYILSPLWQG